MVYTTVTINGQKAKEYLGQTANTFKERFNNHKNSFVNYKKKHSTALCSYIWTKRRESIECDVRWTIYRRAKPYNRRDKLCNLCVTEKVSIATSDVTTSLNIRSEILKECPHKRRYLLNNFSKWKDKQS